MAAADTMAPEQRAAMIRGMVDRLAARLKQDGGDVEGWLRLTRSYAVIGERDKARDAVLDARKSIGGDAGKLRQLDDGLKDLGLE
jgi:cytochrome c-type biogenesis protein CcmH